MRERDLARIEPDPGAEPPRSLHAIPVSGPDHLLTARDVADLLRIDLSTVYLWVEQGKIPYFNLSQVGQRRCLRFSRASILAWLDGLEQRPTIDRRRRL